MRFKAMAKRLVLSATAVALMAGGTVAVTASPALAAGTTCKTVNLGSPWYLAIRPKMTVPICFNGSRVWQNGNVTGGVDTTGYSVDDISWVGTYNSGGSWIGAGLNYRATIYGGWASFSCASRWTLNASGNQTSFSRGC